MDNKTLAKSVGDLIERTIERVSPRPRRAIVTGVSGNTIQVSRNGPGIPVQELIEVVGIVPAVGDVVVVEKDEAGLYYAYSLASRSVGVGTAGSLPTASDVQNNLGMQTAYTVQNSGVAVRTGPTFLNFRNGLTAAVSGLGAAIDVLFGGSGGKNGVSNSVARFDHEHNVADAYDYNGGAGSVGQVLTKNSTGWAPATPATPSSVNGLMNRDTWAIYVGPRNYNITKQIPVSATGTYAVAAGRTYMVPWVFSEAVTIDQAGFEVTTAGSGTASIAIWSTQAEGDGDHMLRPRLRLSSVASVSTATTGVKSPSLSFTFQPHVVYLMLVRFSAACTVRSGTPGLDVFTAGSIGSADRCAMAFADGIAATMNETRPGNDLILGSMIIFGIRVASIA